MRTKHNSVHVALPPRFVISLLLFDFILLIVSVVGLCDGLPFLSAGLWLCVFVTTITGTFLLGGLVSIGCGARFYLRLGAMTQTPGKITGMCKQTVQQGTQRDRLYITVYSPAVTYRFRGEEREWVGQFASSAPKWSVGEEIMLYVDDETGFACEKRDGVAALLGGIGAALLGGGLTAAVWLAYLGGLFA